MCRYRQGLAVGADENAVASTVVAPVDLVLPGHGLQLFKAPVQRVLLHGLEQLRGLVHWEIVFPVISNVKHWSRMFRGK